MKENSIKNERSSIEEDIKIAERFIKSIKTDKEYKKEGWHGYFNEEIVELARILEHILSDYKRVLKEIEELKQEKINNDRMIVLAQNETLNYMRGYEDGKNSRRSAVACQIENQQYFLFDKQIEKYKEYIEKLQRENEEKTTILLAGAEKVKQLEKENNRLEEQVEYDKTHIYTPQTIELNFISKSKIEDKIEEIDKKIKREENEKVVIYLYKQRKVLQELLEENENHIPRID